MVLPAKVIVITGATSGIGLSLLERILLATKLTFMLRICILCRNMKKGEFVRSTLMLSHKSAEIDLVKMDTGDMRSVLDAAKVIKEKYTHIDYLYLNAGILPIKNINFMALFSRDIFYRLKTGDKILVADNPINEFGIPTVFATNTLGHFLLFQDLLPLLKSSGEKTVSKIIWTTSNNAVKDSFDMRDFMCEHGTIPYGSSKYIMNGVSLAINQRYNKDGVYSCLAEPGLCVTGLNGTFLPGWLWKVAELLFTLLRVFLSNMTLSAYNGSEALYWLFKQDPRNMEKDYQYESAVNVFNQPYVRNARLEITREKSEDIFKKMCKVSEDVRQQVKDWESL